MSMSCSCTLVAVILVALLSLSFSSAEKLSSVNSSSPTSHPSSMPSGVPTSMPSNAPSPTPSIAPSTQFPSSHPSYAPSFQPTSYAPTAIPTSQNAVRSFPCGKCERTYFDDQEEQVCQFYSNNIELVCDKNSTSCFYSTHSFVVDSLANIVLSENCGLVVKTIKMMNIKHEASVTASYVNITSSDRLIVSGTVKTTGGGPIDGPGSGHGSGEGGSYGGSGGSTVCAQNSFFSNFDYQIGSIDVFQNIPAVLDLQDSDPNYPVLGSGGGKYFNSVTGDPVYGGRGGGMIVLSCKNSMQLFEGQLLSEGSASISEGIGSGSGGSIAIKAGRLDVSIQKPVYMSVRGGKGSSNENIAAGGGGRISIHTGFMEAFDDITSIFVAGGVDEEDQNQCLNGAAGTMYLLTGVADDDKSSFFMSAGSNKMTWTATVVDQPSLVNSLTTFSASNNATIALNSVELTPIDALNITTNITTKISLVNSNIIPLGQLSNNGMYNSISFSSNEIELLEDAHVRQPTVFFMDATIATIDSNSEVDFGCLFVAHGYKGMFSAGKVSQSVLPSACQNVKDTLNYSISSGCFISSENTTEIGHVSCEVIGIKGHDVNILGPYVGVPQSFNLSTCFYNISAHNTSCAAIFKGGFVDDIKDTVLSVNNQILVVSNQSVKVQPLVEMESSLIEICSSQIYIDNSTLSSTGRGCSANSGVGAGAAPASKMSSAGGGGAGFGGKGGDGSTNTPGGITYGLARETFSVGSGGGGAVGTLGSAGGGFVLLAAFEVIAHGGQIITDGTVGTNNAGGGSGGMVYIFTQFLHGNGSISVVGGDGGPTGGGGGGGGRIEIDAGGSSAKYDFGGTIEVQGGLAIVSDELYPQNGGEGAVTWPSCPPGYGNDYSSYTICYPCDIGYYSDGGEGECVPCSNKPSGSHYTERQETSPECSYECQTGRQGSECLTSFGSFVQNIGGFRMFVLYTGVIFFAVFAPLLVLRARKSSSKHKTKYRRKRENQSISVSLFSIDNSTISNFFSHYSFKDKDKSNRTESQLPTEQLLSEETAEGTDLHYKDMSPNISIGKQQYSFQEMRLGNQLSDRDLRYHVGRIYLEGVNSPFHWRGGQWYLPPRPPSSLANLFVPENDPFLENDGEYNFSRKNNKIHSYLSFTEEVNASVRWEMNSWEVLYYCLLLVVFPPRAEKFLLKRRLVRVEKLFDTIFKEDWNFFASPHTSLRVGVSPDLTLACMDVVHHESRAVPRLVGRVGQPRLPNCFRFSGLGTYFFPWYIDTNDVLMQSISHVQEVCIFIDKAWINFIVELNMKLRKVRRYSLTGDLTILMQELLDEKFVGALGGVIAQFCCFARLESAGASTRTSSNTSDEFDVRSSIDSKRNSIESFNDVERPNAYSINPHKELPEFTSFRSMVDDNGNKHESLPDSYIDPRNINTSQRSPTHVRQFSGMGEMSRPVGFGETCRRISCGQVYPGIAFFHESTPVEDVVNDDDDSDVEEGHKKDESKHSPVLEKGFMVKEDERYGATARGVYGSKVEELDKFYKILASADEKNTQDPPTHATARAASASASASASGGSNSNRGVFFSGRDRTDSHATTDSSVERESCASSDVASRRDWRYEHGESTSPLSISTSNKISLLYDKKVQIWSWNQASSKPMPLTRKCFSNCNSTSQVKLVYPTTVEVVGEVLSSLFRSRLKSSGKGSTIGEGFVKFLQTINRIVTHGNNHLPRHKMFSKVMTGFFFLFIFIDIVCTCFLSINYWCIWGNRTSCDNHTGLALMHAVWPGALIFAPLVGLYVVILNSTGTVAREYVCWSRLAICNALSMTATYILWSENAKAINVPIIVLYACSRFFQNYYFDHYIATVEVKRSSRGWGGLYTSLTNFEHREFL